MYWRTNPETLATNGRLEIQHAATVKLSAVINALVHAQGVTIHTDGIKYRMQQLGKERR